MQLQITVDLSDEELSKEFQTKERHIIDGVLKILRSYDIMDPKGEDFRCVEEIVCLFEDNGYDCLPCHDF